MSKTVALFVLVACVLGACGSASPETTTTTSTTTTSTTTTIPPTTTTTVPPFGVEGVPEELTALVDSFYDYATGASASAPALPDAVAAAITPAPFAPPLSGTGSVGVFGGQTVAVVEAGNDLFLAVQGEQGWRIIGGSWPELGAQYFGEFPRLVAVVGSDARPGEDRDHSRGDSLHVVGLDGNGEGSVVGIPRDAYVNVPGVGRNRISAALSLGGPDTLFRTMNETTGLPLEGYVLTGFEGFRALVGSVLGGIEVDVPFAINDKWAKAYFEAGRQILNGKQALAFARPRKTLSGGDFARSELQGMLLIGAARTVKTQGYGAIPPLLEASELWITTNMSAEQLLTFSAAAVSADLETMPNTVVPGRGGRAGNASVVFLTEGANEIWADLADGRLGD